MSFERRMQINFYVTINEKNTCFFLDLILFQVIKTMRESLIIIFVILLNYANGQQMELVAGHVVSLMT